MKQENINVERGRDTPKPPVSHPDTYPIIQKWILRFPLRLRGSNHRRPRHYRQYRPYPLCVYITP